jgi:two-component system CheB/CheR fusion protein
LANAIKFSPRGAAVDIRCQRTQGEVTVEVSDHGQGIDPDLLPVLFNAFEQGGAGTTRQFGGLGLGLTICKGLVELHGGTISAHSEGKGQGATFRVTLPLAQATPDNPQRTRVAAVRPLRILLVEDHADTARVTRLLLKRHGHNVQLAGNVATALGLASQESFDLLLSDLGLPDGSGLDLLRQLRQRGNRLPAIAVSGYGLEDDLRRSREAGFAAHLVKPTSVEHLAAAIAKVMAGQLT